jgi:hypothetical protein
MARTNQMTFRHWCQEKWYEYIDECSAFNEVPVLEPNMYFSKYKYWLKREYKHYLKD